MSPQFASAVAARLFAYRWWFLAVALCSTVVLVAATFLSASSPTSNLFFAALGPFSFLPWGLLCLCVWFGPSGKFNLTNSSVSAWRRVQSWYFSVGLSFFLLMGTIAWPLLVAFA